MNSFQWIAGSNFSFLPFHVHDTLFSAWLGWIRKNFIQWRTPIFHSKAWRGMISSCLCVYPLSCGFLYSPFPPFNLWGGGGGAATYNNKLNETLLSGAKLVVRWWWRCFCFWISKAPGFVESYWWPDLLQVRLQLPFWHLNEISIVMSKSSLHSIWFCRYSELTARPAASEHAKQYFAELQQVQKTLCS